MGEENMQECPFDDPLFQDFFEQGQVEKLTIMEKEDYAKSILEYREVKDTIEYEREYAREEGRAEGLAEGKAEGRLEGLAEGEAKGKVEGIRATAKKLLSLGLDIDTISKATGLSEDEIREL